MSLNSFREGECVLTTHKNCPATADVAIAGWRLERLTNYLREGELLAVRTLPDRYAQLDTSKTFVVQITVQSMSKD